MNSRRAPRKGPLQDASPAPPPDAVDHARADGSISSAMFCAESVSWQGLKPSLRQGTVPPLPSSSPAPPARLCGYALGDTTGRMRPTVWVFRVYSLGLWDMGSGIWDLGLEFGVLGFGFWVEDFGFGILNFGFRV